MAGDLARQALASARSPGVAGPRRPGRARPLLASILALAFCHALVQARIRPLFQSSDELNYTFAAQYLAWTTADATARPCIFPPDGEQFHMPAGSGKAGYRHVTSAQISLLCRWAPQQSPFFKLRALHAASLPIVVGCAWYLGWLLTAQARVATVAAVLVAANPVAAMHAGAIGPDAWANALSAVALVAGARLVADRWRWSDAGLLLAVTAAAIGWKDTTNFLLLHFAMALAVAGAAALRAIHPPRKAWLPVALALATAAVAVVASASVVVFAPGLMSPYLGGADVTALVSAPRGIAARLVQDLVTQAPGLLATAVTGIGSFGASTLSAPASVGVLALAVGALGGTGLLLHLLTSWDHLPSRQQWLWVIWACCGLACLAQPSVRQVLLDTLDVHQGRWLQPVLAPAAVALAIGLCRWLKTWRALLPMVILCAAGVALTQVQMVSYFYVSFPTALRIPNLFLRSTSGTLINDEKVLWVIEHALQAQDPRMTWALLVGLLTSVAAVLLALTAATNDDPDAPSATQLVPVRLTEGQMIQR